jgi:hypothetical protein
VSPEQQSSSQTRLPVGQQTAAVLHCPAVGQHSPSTPAAVSQQMLPEAQHASPQLTVPAAQHSPSSLHSWLLGQQTKLSAPSQTRPRPGGQQYWVSPKITHGAEQHVPLPGQ